MVPPTGLAADVRDAVVTAKAGEPLARVTVVPPSALGGLSVRRALASGRTPGGVSVNVAWRSLGEVAGAVVRGLRGQRARLPRAARLGAVGDVVGSRHRATVLAYDAAFRSLRRCSPAAVAAVAGGSAAGAALVERFEAFCSATAACDDEVDALLRAAAAVRAGDTGVGPVVLVQPGPLTWAEQQLVDALDAAGRLTVVGAAGCDAEVPVPTRVVIAPDAEAEVRLAIGEVLRVAGDGVPLDRVALVHAGGEPYPRLVAELLDASCVPWAGARPGTLAATFAGRTLLDLASACAVAPTWNASASSAMESLAREITEPAERAAVESAVGALAALDGMGPPPASASFADAVAMQLDVAVPPAAAAGGVLVGAVEDVAGADVDAVVLVGVNEGRLPGRHADDPLLPDQLRALTGGELPTRRERRRREQQLVASLLRGARERVLCAARADQRAQQEQLPSRWLAGDCERVEVPSFAAAVLTRPAASSQEAALQALAAGEPPESFGLGRGVEAIAARASAAITEWDGGVGPHPALAARGRRSAAGAFERWATCPFQHFLRSVLRVQDARSDPPVRGALVHAVLGELDRARVDGDEAGADIGRATKDACAHVEQSGRAGKPLAWLLEQRTLAANLAAVAELDGAERAASGFRTVDADVTFGDARVGGVRFAGHVDRVDAAEDGRRRVVDYRTGRSDYLRREVASADPTVAGTRLQLPVAALAAGAASATYWFVTESARGYPRVEVEVGSGVARRVAEVVEQIADGIEAGAFAPNPGDAVLDSWSNCRRCPYDRVCPSERGDAAERKQDDPAMARLKALRVRQEGGAG